MFQHKVELPNCTPIDGVYRKDELVKSGLYLNVDFSWAYYAPQYDNDGYHEVIPRRVVFCFRDAATATFFQLKWA